MKVLGIDQSYTSCACVIREGDKVIDVKVIKTDKTVDIYTRAHTIALAVCDLVSCHNVDLVAIEGLALGMRGDATRDLAGLLFSIILLLKINHPNITPRIVAPTSLKKFATGSGKADKSQMIESLPVDVREMFTSMGFKKTTGLTDVTDAYWLATLVCMDNI